MSFNYDDATVIFENLDFKGVYSGNRNTLEIYRHERFITKFVCHSANEALDKFNLFMSNEVFDNERDLYGL